MLEKKTHHIIRNTNSNRKRAHDCYSVSSYIPQVTRKHFSFNWEISVSRKPVPQALDIGWYISCWYNFIIYLAFVSTIHQWVKLMLSAQNLSHNYVSRWILCIRFLFRCLWLLGAAADAWRVFALTICVFTVSMVGPVVVGRAVGSDCHCYSTVGKFLCSIESHLIR